MVTIEASVGPTGWSNARKFVPRLVVLFQYWRAPPPRLFQSSGCAIAVPWLGLAGAGSGALQASLKFTPPSEVPAGSDFRFSAVPSTSTRKRTVGRRVVESIVIEAIWYSTFLAPCLISGLLKVG